MYQGLGTTLGASAYYLSSPLQLDMVGNGPHFPHETADPALKWQHWDQIFPGLSSSNPSASHTCAPTAGYMKKSPIAHNK